MLLETYVLALHRKLLLFHGEFDLDIDSSSEQSVWLLTGAGRVALGNDIPAVFSNNMTSLQVSY